MRLLVDLSPIDNPYIGVGIYAFRLLKGWSKLCLNNNILLLINKDLESYIHLEFAEYEYIVLKSYGYHRNKLLRIIFKYKLLLNISLWANTINISKCDIVFAPWSNPLYSRKLKIKKVQTIHDLQGGRVFHGLKKFYFKTFTPFLLKNSTKIITISNFVKNDLLTEYPELSLDKLETIYNGIDYDISVAKSTLKLDFQYILSISTLWPYKNVLTIVEAFIALIDFIPHKLVIVGRETEYWSKIIMPLIYKNNIEDRLLHLPEVSNDDLVFLYKHADLYVSASLHEGFGYTPIEAAIYGVPVITTKETALPETTMGLLNYYEPSCDSNSLKNKILNVLRNYPKEMDLNKISQTFKTQYNYIQQAQKVYNCIENCFYDK